MNSAADVWARVMKQLEKELTPTAIAAWFDDAEAVEMTDELLVLSVGSTMKRDVITRRFSNVICAALKDIFSGGEYRLLVLNPDDLNNYMRQGTANGSTFPGSARFTFDNFVVGNSNKFAAAAARAVADHPAESYNPLFIYGASGLGKTHLLNAIAHEIHRNHPEFRIVYLKGDDFINELVEAIQAGKNKDFRTKYRNADLLLVDDIQFIAGKRQTQEEFFHTFNALHESGKQIVLTADRPPKEMATLDERLRTRFEWGLLADIQPPDLETRMAITKKKALLLGLNLPDVVIEYIADNVSTNVRQLEGTVRKILAYQDLMDDPVGTNSVNRAIKDIFKDKVEFVPTPDIIIEEVSKYYLIDEAEIRGQKRNKEMTLARQIAMYLIRNMTDLSLVDIGRQFENRDHTTVLNAIKRVEDYNLKNSGFADTLRDIKSNIFARA